MNTSIRKFLAEENGVTALEYGMVAAIVAVIVVTIFHNQLGGLFNKLFATVSSQVDTATGPASSSSS